MKSKLTFAAVLALFVAGGLAFDMPGNGSSYSDQLCELIQQRDAGLISHEEYWSVKKQLIRVMRH